MKEECLIFPYFQILEDFIKEFHEQNPISQLGIIATHNKIAKRYSDLSNNPQRHLDVSYSCLNPCVSSFTCLFLWGPISYSYDHS